MRLISLSMEQWQAFAETRPDALAFHHVCWQQALAEAYNFEWQAWGLVKGGEVVAGAPFLASRTLTGSRKLGCLPFSDHVGPLAATPEDGAAYWEALSEHQFRPFAKVVVRTVGPEPPVPSTSDWVRHRVDLTDHLANSPFPSSVRRNLRKAEKAGLEFRLETDPSAMAVFYRLHVLTRRRLGVPVQAKAYFRKIQERIVSGGLGFVATVHDGPRVIAAAVFLGFAKSLIYKYGASDPEALALRPNELLFARAIATAREMGYDHFDFGVTKVSNEGLRRFKMKWGSREDPVYHAFLRGQPSAPSGTGVLHRVAGSIIRSSPPFVCRALGAALYRYAS